MILGMDWLSSCYASMDCRQKSIVFRHPSIPIYVFYGSRGESPNNLISVFQARRLLRRGCEYYLAFVHSVDVKPLSLDQIPVVSEFLDVFLENLLGLPADREIEFCIDLILGTQPISISPYRMAPENSGN